MSSQIKIKRSSVAGKVPTTSDIATGELAVNTTDKKIYSSNGTAVFGFTDEYLQVANAASTYVLKNSAVFTGALTANGVSGVPGYYLRSSGSGIYWSPGGASWASLSGTNTALRTFISDRMQVANTKAYLANTNAYIATKVDTTTFNYALANTNAYIASVVSGGGGVPWSSLTSTNTAIRTLISDRLQVANAAATYQTKSVERAALANTNSYIATKASWTALTGTNTAIRNLVSDRYQVANVNTLLAAKATWTGLTGTNTALRLLINDRLQVANALAIGAGKASWAALTATNTAIRALVSDRYQVANVDTNFLKKSGTVPQTVVPNVSFSANVAIQGKLTVYGGVTTYSANNLSIGDNMIYLNSGSVASNPDLGFAGNYNDGTYHHAGFFRDASDAGTWKVFENYSPEPDAATAINTAHATFKLAPFSARDARFTGVLSVTANTSVGNTTVGGFLKLDGTDIRATFAQNTYVKTTLANTNLRVNLINTNLTGTNTALRTLISDRLQVANASTTYLTKNNPVITGTLTANGVAGTAGYYLRTSGTGIYWSPVAGGGGSAANGFSGILVGANVVSADSTTDRLTLVAGSGITIAANPTTDTITFTATGGGGSFTGGTISGATTVSNTTASTSNLTGAFKVTGGVGVTGNIYTAGRVGYASNTTSGTSAAYTYYNSASGSLDTVFG